MKIDRHDLIDEWTEQPEADACVRRHSDGWTCTRVEDHEGWHASLDLGGTRHIIAVWDDQS